MAGFASHLRALATQEGRHTVEVQDVEALMIRCGRSASLWFSVVLRRHRERERERERVGERERERGRERERDRERERGDRERDDRERERERERGRKASNARSER